MSYLDPSKPVVVVAGQTPPPTGGQNVMVQRILEELSVDRGWRTVHLPFYFTPNFQTVRRFRVGKVVELYAVFWRFLGLVARHGRPDILLYPSGGPQTVPVIRDILLLPILCLFSRRVTVQFHAAGIAERLRKKSGLLEWLLRWAYRRVGGAIVMTDFNRCDPEALGIANIAVIPHRLPDENPEGKLPDYSAFPNSSSLILPPSSFFTLLYAGHLYDLKGTPQLIEAFGEIASEFPWIRLVLMGEFLPPYSEEECRARCRELRIEDRVEITGVLHGENKASRFQQAHLFIFPSIAPYESFGLVMVEAMMWGLPILATDWRGNRDVAGPGGIYAAVDESMRIQFAETLRKAFAQPQALVAGGTRSRRRFEEHFCLGLGIGDYRQWTDEVLNSDRQGLSKSRSPWSGEQNT